jgi:hypothetical protein
MRAAWRAAASGHSSAPFNGMGMLASLHTFERAPILPRSCMHLAAPQQAPCEHHASWLPVRPVVVAAVASQPPVVKHRPCWLCGWYLGTPAGMMLGVRGHAAGAHKGAAARGMLVSLFWQGSGMASPGGKGSLLSMGCPSTPASQPAGLGACLTPIMQHAVPGVARA